MGCPRILLAQFVHRSVLRNPDQYRQMLFYYVLFSVFSQIKQIVLVGHIPG